MRGKERALSCREAMWANAARVQQRALLTEWALRQKQPEERIEAHLLKPCPQAFQELGFCSCLGATDWDSCPLALQIPLNTSLEI